MRDQPQFARVNRVTLAAKVLAPDKVSQAKPDIHAAIGQAIDASRDQRVRATLTPRGQVRAAEFVQRWRTGGIRQPKLAAAFQVGGNDGADRGQPGRLASQWRHGQRKLRQSHTGYFDPKLGQGRHNRPCRHGGQGMPPGKEKAGLLQLKGKIHARNAMRLIQTEAQYRTAAAAFRAGAPPLPAQPWGRP